MKKLEFAYLQIILMPHNLQYFPSLQSILTLVSFQAYRIYANLL